MAEILVTTGKNRNEACFIASNLYKEVVEQYSDEVIVQQLLGIYESTYQLT
ncbi:hypothetical protein JCM19231_2500 [Vibrio ishigakensis]|uniref:Uncharacterized protein n=1 Tax=Vibrio ishigakensis TaxID=1481914 RepID=A0A0B8NQK1_9VIBR|nr:hypothetical protein JCM19231_2500 [Vibrio ishigakensis]